MPFLVALPIKPEGLYFPIGQDLKVPKEKRQTGGFKRPNRHGTIIVHSSEEEEDEEELEEELLYLCI